jgi:UrcA family protein
VRYDDLDLTTDGDIHRLHERIFATAREVCGRLERRYPMAVSDSPPCYRTAVDNAEPLAMAAIDRANER